MRTSRLCIAAVLALARASFAQDATPASAAQPVVRSEHTTVDQIARFEQQGETVLWGQGLVFGLNGTGDSGKDANLARALMEYYRNGGNPIGSIDELKNAKSVALVDVTCTIPAAGGKMDDTFTISVQAIHGAKSLVGGELFLTPLKGPYNSGPASGVFAMAQGRVIVEDPNGAPRVGIVRGGARLIKSIDTTPRLTDSFTLILRPEYAGFAAASEVASRIRDEYNGRRPRDAGETLPTIATVIDDRTIRVDIPDAERASPAGFAGSVMRTSINPALMGLPARVICNQMAGIIVMTGDVEISPVAITQKDMTITTTIPAPVPTADNPLIKTDHWTGLSTGARPADRAKLNDLLEAFNQLKVPVSEQIAILTMLQQTGKLHAQLIVQ
jgi:flagellar P-ring protein precursor FlgI